ncbi:hypothetical protein Ccel01_34120 [Cellulosimicrobium cellulans]|uniref:Uncharacterized protein n=1 Tax=Cellulosimicrobium cellulans TaxID=1710 RepID=A0AAV5P9T0_CELCE|nr:hypothetical protein Ccel01_34120 [Cellulosimicrobium cellulans]
MARLRPARSLISLRLPTLGGAATPLCPASGEAWCEVRARGRCLCSGSTPAHPRSATARADAGASADADADERVSHDGFAPSAVWGYADMPKAHPVWGGPSVKGCPAASYSPTPSPGQYHRR